MRLNVESLEAREVPSATVTEFTPPIGSNKGSFAGDGWWLGVRDSADRTAPAENGIIAILIGLRESVPPTGGTTAAQSVPIGFTDLLVTAFQGGCAKQGETVS